MTLDAPQGIVDQLIEQIGELDHELLTALGSWIIKNKEMDPTYMEVLMKHKLPFDLSLSRFYNPARGRNSSYQITWSMLVDVIYPTLLKSGLEVTSVGDDTYWHLMMDQIDAIRWYGATQNELDLMMEFYHWDRGPGSPYHAGADICLMIRYGYLVEGILQEDWDNALRAIGIIGDSYAGESVVFTHPNQMEDHSWDGAVEIKMPIIVGKVGRMAKRILPTIWEHAFDPKYPDVVLVSTWNKYQYYLAKFQRWDNKVPMDFEQFVAKYNLKEYNPKDYLNNEWRNNYIPKKLIQVLNVISNYAGVDAADIKLSPKQFNNCLRMQRNIDLHNYLSLLLRGRWDDKYQAVLDKFGIVMLEEPRRDWMLRHLNTDPDLIMKINSKWKTRWADWNLARIIEELKNEDLMINEDEYDKFRNKYGMPDWNHRPQKWLSGEVLDTVVTDEKYTIKSADLDDIRVVRYGYETHCCQHFGGAAEGCVRYGLMEPNSWFLEIRSNLTGQLVGQGWYWVDTNRNLVIDNIELANDRPMDSVLPILKEWAEKVGEAYLSVVMGCGYNTIITADMTRISVDTSILKGTYTDARTSVVLAGKYHA